MRWPIRNQILIPLLVLQSLTIISLTLLAVWLNQDRAGDQIISRLENVARTLEQSWYPLTHPIMTQLKLLSGAELIVLRNDDLQTTLETSISIPLTNDDWLGLNNAELNRLITVQGQQYLVRHLVRSQSSDHEQVFILYPKESYDQQLAQAVWMPVVLGALVLLFTAAISLWVAQQIARRIQRVQQQVARIAEGDFATVTRAGHNDELADLLITVNRMSMAMQNLITEVQIASEHKTLGQLASSMAHHLRNAMTGARISLQLHQRRCQNDDRQSIQVALDQLSRSERQIQSLLRLASGNAVSNQAESLQSVLTQSISYITPLCEHQKIRFNTHCPLIECQITNAEALLNALLNLLTNAIEAAGPGGVVSLTTRSHNQDVLIEIEDNGPGVVPQLSQTLFDAFVTSKPEGTGIGLAIAQQTTRALNGELSYTREAETTRFTLRFPHPDGHNTDNEVMEFARTNL